MKILLNSVLPKHQIVSEGQVKRLEVIASLSFVSTGDFSEFEALPEQLQSEIISAAIFKAAKEVQLMSPTRDLHSMNPDGS